MIKPIQKVVSSYRKQSGLSLRNFAQELSAGLKEEDRITYETIRNWERGIYNPNFGLLMTLVMTTRDWRSDFAFDCLSAIRPEIYPPVTSIGEEALLQTQTETEEK